MGLLPQGETTARPALKLAGRTVIRASSAVMAPIVLEAEVTLRSGDEGLLIRGGGRFAGFALFANSNRPTGVIGGRLPPSAGSEIFTLPVGEISPQVSRRFQQSGEIVLRPGPYRLYVIPGRRQTEIQLTFEELGGRTLIEPREPASYRLAFPKSRLREQVKSVHSAGSEAVIESNGLLFNALWLTYRTSTTGSYDFCLYRGNVPEPVAYGPRCPLAETSEHWTAGVISLTPYMGLFYGALYPVPPDLYGQGVFYATGSVVEQSGYMALWLSTE